MPSAPGTTLGQLLDRAVQVQPDREVYVSQGRRVTFRQLAEDVDLHARALMAQGIAPGHRVSLWMANTVEWVVFFLAAARVGAVVVPLNTGFTVDEAAYVVGQSDSVLLVASPGLRDRDLPAEALRVLADDRVSARTVVAVGRSTPGTVTMNELLEGASRVSADELAARTSAVDADDVVLTLYTSGTTGFPKGVMHSHKVIRNMADAAERLRLTSDDTVVMYLPLFHIFALAAVLTFLHTGGKMVLLDSFDTEVSLDLMVEERASVVYGVGTHYYDQLRSPSFPGRDLSRLRLCLSPGTGDLVRTVSAQMATAVNVYGMTETTSMTSVGAPDDPLDARADTVGRPLPGSEVKVVDSQGRALPPGEVGELLVRGHPVMLGYYSNPEATAKALQDGWFHTGDAVSETPEGYLRFVGRISEMFKVGGENVDPIEVEAVLMRHPAVAMASVVGVPDDRLGEVGLACVTPLADQAVDVDDLRAFARQRLASFKVPRHVRLVDGFPMTASGKVQKYLLREAFLLPTLDDARTTDVEMTR